MKFRKRKCIPAIGLSILLILAGCGESEENVAKKEVVVETCTPVRGDLTITGSFMGTVAPEEEVYVIPLVNGEVETVNVSVGDSVKEGAVLGTIDDTAARLQLESANASLDTIEANKKAATGGANTLQNMQTEANIETIKDNIDVIGENRDKLADARQEIQEQMDELNTAKIEARTAYDDAEANYQAVLLLTQDPSNQEAAKTLEASGIRISQSNPVQAVLATCQAAFETAAQVYEKVEESYNQTYPALQKQYDELESSRKELNRNEDSLKDNLKLAQDSYELSKGQIQGETKAVYDAQIQSAQVGVESAKYQQDMYTLKAPISGTVESVQIEEKGFASTGSPAFIISNKNTMKVSFKVSEDIQKTLSKGDAIRVERADHFYDGTITEIGQMVDMQSGLFLIEAKVKAGGDELMNGSSVKLYVPTYKEKSTLIIPYDAILYDNTESFVYVVKDGKAVKTPVEVALFDEEYAAISSGITDTDEVIKTYSASLTDQAAVSVKKSSKQED